MSINSRLGSRPKLGGSLTEVRTPAMKITKRALLHADAAAPLSKHLPISDNTPVSSALSANTLTQAVDQTIARAETAQALNAYVTLDTAGLHQQAQALAQREHAAEAMPSYGTVVALELAMAG